MKFEPDPRANWDLRPWLWSDWRVPHLPLGIYAARVGWSSIYIGSGNLMERFKFHWKTLSLGRHNTLIQAAVDRVGPGMIGFDVLQCAPDGTPGAALPEAVTCGRVLHAAPRSGRSPYEDRRRINALPRGLSAEHTHTI